MPTRTLVELMDHYMALAPDGLIDEARRLAARDHVQDDPEVAVLIGVLTGRIAALVDQLAALRPDTVH